MNKQECLAAIRGGIIVSCQALPGEPLYMEGGSSIMYLMARAAKQAGAVAIRTNGVHDVVAIREETGLPVIGLMKRTYPDTDVYITPTMAEVDALVLAGADIVAVDCTMRPRPGGQTVEALLAEIRERYPNQLLMADISTLEEGLHAAELGVHCVGTTLSGYTPYSPGLVDPDFALVEGLAKALQIPVIAEGRIAQPEQAARMMACGAHAVVVGGAITRPLEIARRYTQAVADYAPQRDTEPGTWWAEHIRPGGVRPPDADTPR